MPACGHKSQIVDNFRVVTRADGTSERERIQQSFRPRGDDARYCGDCGQIVDTIDDMDPLSHGAES